MSRTCTIDRMRMDLKPLFNKPLEKEFDVGGRNVLIPVSPAWTVVGLVPALAPSPQEMLERISELEEQIGNLQRLHQTIERNNGLFEALIAAGRDGICLTRLDGSLIRVVKSILGYDVTQLDGLSIFDLIHPDDRESVRQQYARISSGAERSVLVETRMIQADGTAARVQDRITDMLDNPAVHAVVHNYQNVTELRAGELAAAELDTVIRHAPFAMFSKSIAGEILSWNEGAQAMFGYARTEILGRHVSILVPAEFREEEQHRRSLVIDRGEAMSRVRTVRLRKDGTPIPIELVLSPVITGGQVAGLAHLSYPLTSE